ncbi:MAG: hypothetical protein KA028_00305 [Candidatus Pacebacteria bacterium]|nr:hypothetical protein [Candidatus Paceibacterota bacterium]MBP9851946.1 hypothetical protein [Candidatus Paceibacterota bacterium]
MDLLHYKIEHGKKLGISFYLEKLLADTHKERTDLNKELATNLKRLINEQTNKDKELKEYLSKKALEYPTLLQCHYFKKSQGRLLLHSFLIAIIASAIENGMATITLPANPALERLLAAFQEKGIVINVIDITKTKPVILSHEVNYAELDETEYVCFQIHIR